MIFAIINVVSRFFETVGLAKTIAGFIALALVGTGVVYGPHILNILSNTPNALTILTHIQEEAHLDTVRANYTIQVSAGIIAGHLGMYSYNGDFRGDGEIIAGIDLSQLSESDIFMNESGGLSIHLPPPQFTLCSITNFQQISSSITLFNADWDMLYRLASVDAYNSLTERGLEDRLLEQAEEVAGETLTEMIADFLKLEQEEINIVYATENRGHGSDTSCTPVFPEGWCKEDVNFAWLRC